MTKDNTTPMNASEYDKKINQTIPFYQDFYDQTLDLIEQCNYPKIKWLDLGCGTGTMEEQARKKFDGVKFVLVDPSEQMLDQAKEKLKDKLKGETYSYLCATSESIDFESEFEVVTAIQSHHYMHEEERKKSIHNVYRALRTGGIFISFENVIPEDEELKNFELLRWGRYQQRNGKSAEQAKEHNARCGVNYFPLTVEQHKQLLREAGFREVYVFWRSYMQMGIFAIK